MKTSDRRQFARANVNLKCTLYTEHGPIEGVVGNMSMRGVYVVTHIKPPLGTPCNVFIRLADTSNVLSLQISGSIARHDRDGVGVRLDVLAFEAFQHLSRIVLLNSDDPDEVEAEMDRHVGLRPRTGKKRKKRKAPGK